MINFFLKVLSREEMLLHTVLLFIVGKVCFAPLVSIHILNAAVRTPIQERARCSPVRVSGLRLPSRPHWGRVSGLAQSPGLGLLFPAPRGDGNMRAVPCTPHTAVGSHSRAGPLPVRECWEPARTPGCSGRQRTV